MHSHLQLPGQDPPTPTSPGATRVLSPSPSCRRRCSVSLRSGGRDQPAEGRRGPDGSARRARNVRLAGDGSSAAVAAGGWSPPSTAVPVVPGTSSPLRAGRLHGSILPCSDPPAEQGGRHPHRTQGHFQRWYFSPALPLRKIKPFSAEREVLGKSLQGGWPAAPAGAGTRDVGCGTRDIRTLLSNRPFGMLEWLMMLVRLNKY